MGTFGARQVICLVVTWMAYASSYLLRKPLGVVKADLATIYDLTRTDLGWLDTALLLPYAVMQMLLASCGDRFGARRALSVCLIGSALSMVSFGFWKSLWVFAFLLFMNGTAQSTAWPNCVKSLTSWFTDQQRNTVFGLFGTSSFAGGILGTTLAVQLQAMYPQDMKFVFLVPSLIVMSVAVLVFFFLHSPSELGLDNQNASATSTSSENKEQKPLTYKELWSLRVLK